ncbi:MULTISPECIES: (d)CMP kinase [unclassified Fusibacter]|uniref:(d)CMP kinase n=1 Tax=unclassified Fusibacter TaxID=2624464 RepID=UPI0010133829|nr:MULTISPECIES: (d)CMP kinase [unclassified Fusibacter]MCK8058823.1 (d)CMP kinase [Fusibacter sp. A2]NPE21897.1 (d)CMP kinase [Fusibacter sp. A1]RXV61468.1 (d)CMP kinase [Fusibacter sp. A1]
MLQITLDGPSGSGKSTLAKLIASKLGITYLDTGAMYRAITYYCLSNKIDVTDGSAVTESLAQLKIDLDGDKIFVNGLDVSVPIRTEETSRNVSAIASIGSVRTYLVKMQQSIAASQPIVMDGRDIGTVVLPNAPYKFFITASVEERARRRYDEQLHKGEKVDYEAIKSDIELRDYKDTNREISPLKAAEDAIHVDTTSMTIDEVVDFIVNEVRK